MASSKLVPDQVLLTMGGMKQASLCGFQDGSLDLRMAKEVNTMACFHLGSLNKQHLEWILMDTLNSAPLMGLTHQYFVGTITALH